jgi:DNA-binding MarR family transcriptional regulator
VRPPDFDIVAEARRNWERHGWAGPDAMVAATSVARAHQIVLARIDGALAPFGLTFSRFEALALLHFSRRGALPMGKIGTRLQVHPTSVTNTVNRLERDGLVRRVASDGDRRTVLAEITPEGRRVAVAAAGALAEADFGLGGLARGELRRIHDAILPLRRAAGDFA